VKKKIPAPAFPALASFGRGYLHQDFLEEHGSPEAALEAFLADASPAEARRLAREWQDFAQRVRGRPPAVVRRLLATELGTAWSPRSAARVVALFSRLDRSGPEASAVSPGRGRGNSA
jgi:hypothetical protein